MKPSQAILATVCCPQSPVTTDKDNRLDARSRSISIARTGPALGLFFQETFKEKVFKETKASVLPKETCKMEGSSLTPQGATKAEARWLGASMKGRRRTCSPFEMLFKKSLLKAAAVKDTTNLVGKNGRRGSTGFAISGLRPDLEDNTVLDIASYRFVRVFSGNLADKSKSGESSTNLTQTRTGRLIRRSLGSFSEALVSYPVTMKSR